MQEQYKDGDRVWFQPSWTQDRKRGAFVTIARVNDQYAYFEIWGQALKCDLATARIFTSIRNVPVGGQLQSIDDD